MFRRLAPILVFTALQIWSPIEGQEPKDDRPWRRLESKHLPNLIRVGKNLYSGGQPTDAGAFREIRALGVKTILSVDGAQPNVTLAQEQGLRYVHLPHGYEGIREETVGALAKAILDLPGPIYVHCHHGKHRSPAALASACVALGWWTPSQGKGLLTEAGTSPHYQGLYRTVEKTPRWSDEKLRDLVVEFRASAPVPPLAKAMVELEHTFDRLQKLRDHRWKALPEDPDLDAGHEALLLEEHFREMGRLPRVQPFPQAFADELKVGEKASDALKKTWMRWKADRFVGEPPAQLDAHLREIQASCVRCHRKYRDSANE